jgi:hypothetical protein
MRNQPQHINSTPHHKVVGFAVAAAPSLRRFHGDEVCLLRLRYRDQSRTKVDRYGGHLPRERAGTFEATA